MALLLCHLMPCCMARSCGPQLFLWRQIWRGLETMSPTRRGSKELSTFRGSKELSTFRGAFRRHVMLSHVPSPHVTPFCARFLWHLLQALWRCADVMSCVGVKLFGPEILLSLSCTFLLWHLRWGSWRLRWRTRTEYKYRRGISCCCRRPGRAIPF